jgi:ADP-ribose pyrophosphatase YjhB (NUDIX family)
MGPRVYPERPLVGVGVVVRRAEKILLIKRGQPPRQGEWSIPGGLIRLGEKMEDCAIREVLEETGLSVRIVGLIDVVDLIERDEKDAVRYHYAMVDFVADWISGEATAGDDAAAVAWASLAELGSYGLWDKTAEIIRRGLVK